MKAALSWEVSEEYLYPPVEDNEKLSGQWLINVSVRFAEM
jgi:hypothetical protein